MAFDVYERKGFSEDCVWDICDKFRSPLPFEHGSRIKLQTLEMIEPVYGVLDSSMDIIDLSYPQLDMHDRFLTYDWIERADKVAGQEEARGASGAF